MAEVITPYKWGGFEMYIDAEERLIYLATGRNVIEIRDLDSLRLVRKIELRIGGITGVALDSENRLWIISSGVYGGDNCLYVVNDVNATKDLRRIRKFSTPASIDSLRISPWGRKMLVADYGRHVVECINEDFENVGILYFPYVSGVRWSLDERVLISSGKFPKHTFLLLITGALHNTMKSGWYGYLADYGTQASNRADAFYYNKILIQWYLGFQEISLPLPKQVPYVIRIGEGLHKKGEHVKEKGFESFTPILVFNKCYIVSTPKNEELILEAMTPYHSIIAPKPDISWEEVDTFKGKYEIEVPGVYRVRMKTRTAVEVYAVCRP